MLKQRVITALILLLVLLPALFNKSPEPFCAVALVLIAAGAWEWGRLNGLGQVASMAIGAVCVTICATAWYLGWLELPLTGLWLVAGAAWVLLGAWALRGGVGAWSALGRTARVVTGIAALCVTWLAAAQARVVGVNFLLSILVLVWAADIGAYFAGRALGGRLVHRKLAPAISPGKSWEGAWGGMICVAIAAFVWRWADGAWANPVPSLYSHLGQKGGWFLLIAVMFMAAMSVVGDLFESLIKRSAGAKDSSNLLPGHGGVLDRVDALLPTLPLAMMLLSF